MSKPGMFTAWGDLLSVLVIAVIFDLLLVAIVYVVFI
jgi:hypothetical protein